MSVRLFLALFVLSCLFAQSRADDAKEAKAVLDSAIKEIGGAKTLADEGSLSGKSKGSITANNLEMKVSNEWTVQGTTKFKWVSEVTINDKQTPITLGLDGGKVWIQGGNNGKANVLPKEYQSAFLQTFAALRMVETLLPFRNKGVTLSHLGEIKIDDRPAVGIKVKRKGEPELDVYFDKKTKLPVKAIMRVKDAGSGSEDVEYVGHFSEYKKFDGRMHFTKFKVERDGKVVLDMERSDIKVGMKQDDSTFAKP